MLSLFQAAEMSSETAQAVRQMLALKKSQTVVTNIVVLPKPQRITRVPKLAYAKYRDGKVVLAIETTDHSYLRRA